MAEDENGNGIPEAKTSLERIKEENIAARAQFVRPAPKSVAMHEEKLLRKEQKRRVIEGKKIREKATRPRFKVSVGRIRFGLKRATATGKAVGARARSEVEGQQIKMGERRARKEIASEAKREREIIKLKRKIAMNKRKAALERLKKQARGRSRGRVRGTLKAIKKFQAQRKRGGSILDIEFGASKKRGKKARKGKRRVKRKMKRRGRARRRTRGRRTR